jgi:hypothetical protein
MSVNLMAAPRELDVALDELVERHGKGDEIVKARAEHAERTGRVFEEDELYEARTVAFLEWFVLERKTPASGLTPVEAALADGGGSEEKRAAWQAWATSLHSLFLIGKLRETGVVLTDLVGGGRFEVDERRRLHGVAAGDIVEARLIGWRGRVRFGRTFCFHPGAAKKAIAGHVKRMLAAGASRADIVDHVASLRVKVMRYRHVAPERVYVM